MRSGENGCAFLGTKVVVQVDAHDVIVELRACSAACLRGDVLDNARWSAETADLCRGCDRSAGAMETDSPKTHKEILDFKVSPFRQRGLDAAASLARSTRSVDSAKDSA